MLPVQLSYWAQNNINLICSYEFRFQLQVTTCKCSTFCSPCGCSVWGHGGAAPCLLVLKATQNQEKYRKMLSSCGKAF